MALAVLVAAAICAQVHMRDATALPAVATLRGSRPVAPVQSLAQMQQWIDPMPAFGTGTANAMIPRPGAPEMALAQMAPRGLFPSVVNPMAAVPPSMYFTSPFDYEADDAANTATAAAPDSWFDRIHKAKNMQGRAYDAISHGMVPRMGWMGTGVHRPINPFVEAQELMDVDPWRQIASQTYALFRSVARNPEMRGETLRRLQKSAVSGFDHTNGQYGVPLGTGLRGVGNGLAGLTKQDYGPYGMGPLPPNTLAHAVNLATNAAANQQAAPMGMAMAMGPGSLAAPFM